MHGHSGEESKHGHAAPALTLEPADPMSCVGPDGVHACGGQGTEDGICRHSDGSSHGCGACPNCRMDEPAVARK